MNSKLRFSLFLLLGLTIGFFGTFLINGNDEASDQEVVETNDSTDKATETDKSGSSDNSNDAEAVSFEAELFTNQGCLQCHSIGDLNLDGGKVGPDLSTAYNSVEEKYGVTLDEFLTKPETGVMNSVISGNPLSDEDRKAIINVLQELTE